MSRINKASGLTKAQRARELRKMFEGVLDDFGVMTETEARYLIKERVEERMEDQEDSGRHEYTPEDLREALPEDVFDVVKPYLSAKRPRPGKELEELETETHSTSPDGEASEEEYDPFGKSSGAVTTGPLSHQLDRLARAGATPSTEVSKSDKNPEPADMDQEMVLKSIYDELGVSGSEDPKGVKKASKAGGSVSRLILNEIDESGL